MRSDAKISANTFLTGFYYIDSIARVYSKKREQMKFLIHRTRWLSAFACLCVVVLTVSCTNLTAVQEWSKTSLEASQFNGIVTTYAETPVRLKRYDAFHFKQYKRPTEEQKRLFALRQSVYAANAIERRNQAEALNTILSVVSDYMRALATLSADGTVDYSKNITTLNTEIMNLNAKLAAGKGISKRTLGAVGSIAQTLMKPYQAMRVKNSIEQANEPLQIILAGELRQIVATDFQDDLNTERDALDLYYGALLVDGHPSVAAQDAVTEWRELRQEQNNARLNAVRAYLTVLDTLSKGHQQLYDHRNNLNDKKLIKNLYASVLDLRKQITILAKS